MAKPFSTYGLFNGNYSEKATLFFPTPMVKRKRPATIEIVIPKKKKRSCMQ